MDHNAHNAVRIFPKETPKTAGSDESAMSSPSDLAPLDLRNLTVIGQTWSIISATLRNDKPILR